MRHCRFETEGRARHGIVEGDEVVDREQGDRHPLSEVRMLAPVQPRKFLAIGLNYADHIAESGMEAPEFPVFFNKQVTCVVGPGDDVHMPHVSNLLDYEGELAVVIGTRARRLAVDDALDAVGGYLCANDVSARDLQFGDGQWVRGKSLDTFCPIGPAVVTRDRWSPKYSDLWRQA